MILLLFHDEIFTLCDFCVDWEQLAPVSGCRIYISCWCHFHYRMIHWNMWWNKWNMCFQAVNRIGHFLSFFYCLLWLPVVLTGFIVCWGSAEVEWQGCQHSVSTLAYCISVLSSSVTGRQISNNYITSVSEFGSFLTCFSNTCKLMNTLKFSCL